MEQKWYTAAEALDVFDVVMSSLRSDDRSLLAASERVALMQRARRVRDRVTSWTCVLTDEAALGSLSSTGTPLTSLIGMDEGRESGDAAKEVLEARDVNKHAAIREAAIDGTVSPRHATAIAKGLAKLPAELTAQQKALAEQAFLQRAASTTPRRLTELAGQVLAEVAPELVPAPGDEDAAILAQRRRARAKRNLSWGDDGDGSTWFKGSLPHLEAAPFLALVQAYVESDRRAERDRFTSTRATKPHPQVVRNQVRDDNHRTPGQRRADALVQIIADHRDGPTTCGDRPRIVVTIGEQDLGERAEKAGVLATGAKITAGDLRRLCCDADLMPAVLGGSSEILDVGRTHRLVTSAIRKALTLRDGGCVFPNCTAVDARCEAHHLTPWWAGGATALHNMVLLCPHHHTLVEPERYPKDDRDRWQIHIDPDTRAPVITAPGRTDGYLKRSSGGPTHEFQGDESQSFTTGPAERTVPRDGCPSSRHGPDNQSWAAVAERSGGGLGRSSPDRAELVSLGVSTDQVSEPTSSTSSTEVLLF